MAKILIDEEMGEIIYDATHEPIIDDGDSYECFLKDLAELICNHFGGMHSHVGRPSFDLGWIVGFDVNENVPADGGVFKDYDQGVTWKNGEETQI